MPHIFVQSTAKLSATKILVTAKLNVIKDFTLRGFVCDIIRFVSLLIMEDIRSNVDIALANIDMEIPIINCLSTPSKLQCNDNNFNVFNGSTNSKVVFQHNDSHKEKIESYIEEKIDEVAANHLQQKILADLKEQ